MAASQLQGLFSTVVYEYSPNPSQLQGLFSTVVYEYSPNPSQLQGLFATTVYDADPNVSDITGSTAATASFVAGVGGLEQSVWTWTSIPGGSSIANSQIAFPDNKATTPINMSGNVGLYHFDSQTTSSVTPLADNGVGSLMANNVGLWHFSSNADDSSGNSNDGTVNGATQVTGKVGANAYEFDGSNDYIEVAHSAELDATTALTIALWVYVDDYGAWSGIVTKGVNAANYSLQQASDGSGKLQFFTGGSPWNLYVRSTAVMPTGEWKHVAVTWDAGTVKFFVDGALDSTHSVAWSLTTNSEALTFGSDFPGNDEYFNGKMDEIAIWTRVLSPAEIVGIYNSQHGLSTTADSSGEAHTATASYAALVTGKVGNSAYHFDSSPGTYITLGAASDYAFTSGDFSIAFWVNPHSSQDAYAPLFSKLGNGGWGSNSRGYWIDQNASTANRYRWGIRHGTSATYGSNFDLTHSVWSHVVATKESGTYKIYVNGSQVTSNSMNDTINQTDNNSALVLGRHGLGYTGNLEFSGSIDEFAIWSRALSSVDIKNIYLAQSGSVAGIGNTLNFVPDVAGTYTVKFETGLLSGSADAVISAVVSGPDGISKIISISKDDIGSILGISYGDIGKINNID